MSNRLVSSMSAKYLLNSDAIQLNNHTNPAVSECMQAQFITHTIGSPYKALERMLTTSCRLPSNSMERKLAWSEPSLRAISSARTRERNQVRRGYIWHFQLLASHEISCLQMNIESQPSLQGLTEASALPLEILSKNWPVSDPNIYFLSTRTGRK